jgi:hypothetical protein
MMEPVPTPKNPKANQFCVMCDGYGKYPAMVQDDPEVVFDYTCACVNQKSSDRGISGITNTAGWLYTLQAHPEVHKDNFDALGITELAGYRGIIATACILKAWNITWSHINRDLNLYGL